MQQDLGNDPATTTMSFEPSYLRLARSGELAHRAARLEAMLSRCQLCPHACGVDRRQELGQCRTGATAAIASATPHFGEEPILSGSHGSGTVFLSGCNLRCVYCQNHRISQQGGGELLEPAALASVFLELQQAGCHNLNWVSPSHQVPQLVRALDLAASRGLSLPVVYNCNAYDSLATLRLLDGVVDIYLPDLRYADAETATRLSAAPRYPHHARAAVAEMYRQVGAHWQLNNDGTLQRGLLVRLLVLPNDLAEVEQSLSWIAGQLSPRVGVSLMAQYYPTYLATAVERYPLLSRTISAGEWARAIAALEHHLQGDHHFVQDHESAPGYYRPDFSNRQVPFADVADFKPE